MAKSSCVGGPTSKRVSILGVMVYESDIRFDMSKKSCILDLAGIYLPFTEGRCLLDRKSRIVSR